MVERPEGWNKELYDKLSFDFLIECAKKDKIEEWNQAYEAYLKSEWERLFPDEDYDSENIAKLIDPNSDTDLVRPDFSEKDFINAIQKKAKFSGVHLEGSYFHLVDFSGADFREAHLSGSDFYFANLVGVYFDYAYLDGCNFSFAQLNESYFWSSHIERSYFQNATLEDANFVDTYLQGAKFILATVNGKTLFSDNTIDDKTDFTGTNLSVVRIDPNLRKHLERNIRKLNITNKNVFVAMKFDCPDLDSALKNAIKPACLECGGLEACTVNEKAGDGWIPQRIKEEIQDARFVISDLTYRNPGVYYETGYADGLEIPVIQTCNKSWYDKDPAPLHFDIAQRNTIFWNDNEDLKQQLIQKIKELQENGK